MSQLDPHAANLLKAEYPDIVLAEIHPGHFATRALALPAPTTDLVRQLEAAAEEAGVVGAIDWKTFLPQLIAAISTGNWFALIPILVNAGPDLWAFVQQIIAIFHHAPTPSIHGS